MVEVSIMWVVKVQCQMWLYTTMIHLTVVVVVGEVVCEGIYLLRQIGATMVNMSHQEVINLHCIEHQVVLLLLLLLRHTNCSIHLQIIMHNNNINKQQM